MNNYGDEFLWVEKYRPKTIEECILPTNIKKTFQDFLDKGEVPNLLLAGPARCKDHCRKSTVQSTGVDVYVINGSDEGRFLDTVRNTAKISLRPYHFKRNQQTQSHHHRWADNTTNDVPTFYLGRLQEFSGTTADSSSTCNFKNKIIEPLHSRCACVDFSTNSKSKPQLAAEFFKRIHRSWC